MNCEQKYLKYKTKYTNLKNSSKILNQYGGKNNKMVKIIFVRHGESTENVANTSGEAYDFNNIVLTTKGEEQARKTGKYLSNTFGKFDCVISSPITRCIQTSNLIMKEINFDVSKIIIDKDVIEIGGLAHPFGGLSQQDTDKIVKSDKQVVSIEKNIAKTTNPYEKYVLSKKLYKHVSKNYEIKPSLYEAHDNLLNFLDTLKNIIENNNYKNILVVSHGGILSLMQKIICGINPENSIIIIDKKFVSLNEVIGNCACLYLGFENEKFILVTPANTYHLTL